MEDNVLFCVGMVLTLRPMAYVRVEGEGRGDIAARAKGVVICSLTEVERI